MEKIKYSVFDFFSYLLPGLMLTVGMTFMFWPDALFKYAATINVTVSVLLILSTYCVGIILNIFGGIYLQVYEWFFPPVIPKHSKLNSSEKYVLVRELSKGNGTVIDQWNTLKLFCANLSFAVLAVGLTILLKNQSWLLGFGSIVISILLLRLSAKYKRWAIIDLDNTIHLFQLKENVHKMLNGIQNGGNT